MESNNKQQYFLCEHYCLATSLENKKLYTRFTAVEMKEYLNYLYLNFKIISRCYECLFNEAIDDIETRLLYIVE